MLVSIGPSGAERERRLSRLLGVNTIDGGVTLSLGPRGAASVLNHRPQMACLMAVSVTDTWQEIDRK